MKIKLSHILIVIVVVIVTFVLVSGKREFFKSLAPLNLPTAETSDVIDTGKFNGNPFFQRQFLQGKTEKPFVYPYNGYRIPTKENEFIIENTGIAPILGVNSSLFTIPTHESTQIIDGELISGALLASMNTGIIENMFSSFIGKNIGTISIKDNDKFNISGIYGGNSNMINFKENAGKGTIAGDNKDLLDSGYIRYLKKLFTDYISTNSEYTFIADNSGEPDIVTNIDNTKEFIVPFFIYESKLNYTTGIVVKFKLIPSGKSIYSSPIYDVVIDNIQETPIVSNAISKLEPAQLHEKGILDTNGYFSIYNHLGLMFPFETSSTRITKMGENLQGESEGEVISQTVFQEQINLKTKLY